MVLQHGSLSQQSTYLFKLHKIVDIQVISNNLAIPLLLDDIIMLHHSTTIFLKQLFDALIKIKDNIVTVTKFLTFVKLFKWPSFLIFETPCNLATFWRISLKLSEGSTKKYGTNRVTVPKTMKNVSLDHSVTPKLS